MRTSPLRNILLGTLSIALLSGCSGALQASMGAPGSPAGTNAAGGGPLTPQRRFALRGLSQIQVEFRPQYRVHNDPTKVALWASNTDYNYLIGQDAKLGRTVDVIDTMGSSCYQPVAIKVDHEQNIWVACEAIDPSSFAQYGGEQEYSSRGILEESYAFDASAQCAGHPYCSALGFDGGPDDFGHVFAELSIGDSFRGYVYGLNTGFYWWNAGDASAHATFIQASLFCAPFCDVDYMDTDNSGNIWFDFDGPDVGHQQSEGGLAEVTNPTTSPAVKVILPPGALEFPGGVFVSDHGRILNVTDQGTRETYQYHLPVKPHAAPFNILGPTPKKNGQGDPISGGFNKAESAFALADSNGLIDVGQVPANTWMTYRNAYCPCASAAFTPSDK